ncbi:MAG: hypothetical protein LBG80_03310 [Bacteroidales bacterium]|nr:hypothetical protein [Bacteroidales bacterium]
MVWKVTATTPHNNLLCGNSIGFFEANYGKWQSAYFADNGGTEAERHVADYVTCAYNECIRKKFGETGKFNFCRNISNCRITFGAANYANRRNTEGVLSRYNEKSQRIVPRMDEQSKYNKWRPAVQQFHQPYV